MEWTAMAASAFLVVKLVDFLRYMTARDWNGVVTQLTSWVAGIISTMLVSRTAWGPDLKVGDVAISSLSFWSLLFVGLTLGSAGSLVKDALKAVDSSDTQKIPTLLPPKSGA